MKFLIRGKCLALALRLLDEGNQVRLSDPFSRTTGEGIVELTDFDKGVRWADIVVFDINDGKLPQEAEKLRSQHMKVIGSSEFAGKLENDRSFGARVAREAGIEVREFTVFKGHSAFSDARDFLSDKRENSEWVWKANQSSPDDPPTYVGTGGLQHFVRMLRHYEQFYKESGRTASFVLMERVEGVEVSTEGWFNGRQFFLPNHTIEKNRLFNEDLGPKTGCSGCVVWSGQGSPLYERLIPPLAAALAGKYCGPVDINAIIEDDSNEPVFLEFTSRFGYDAIYALLELLDGELGSILYSLASGQLIQASLRPEKFAATVRLYIPPYPEDGKCEAEALGVPIDGFDPSRYNSHISPCDLMVDEEGDVVAASPGGQLFAISDIGNDIQSAYHAAYQHIKSLEVPQVGYRTDLPESVSKVYKKLQATGWIGGKVRNNSSPKLQLFK